MNSTEDIKNNNYGALPLSLEVLKNSKIGLWAFELDEGCPPRMYGDRTMMELLGVSGPATPEEVYHAWYDNIDKDHYDEVNEAVDKMKAGLHAEVQYPWHYPDGRMIIVRCGGIKNPLYTKGIRIEGMHRDVTNLSHFEKEQQLLKQVKEAERIIESFVNSYSIACRVNLSEDTFTLLRMDDGTIGKDVEFDSFSSAADYLLNNIVFALDIDKMRHELDAKNIRQRLLKTSEYVEEYRAFINGVTVWNEMNVKSLGGDNVAIGFMEKNNEIIHKKLQERIDEDFYALYAIDLDTGLLSVLKNTALFPTGEVGETLSYENVMKKFAHVQEGETREFFSKAGEISYLRKAFFEENRHTYSYQSFADGEKKWITVTAYVVARHADNTPAVITVAFSFLDTLGSDRAEFQTILKENMEIIGGLTSEYLALFYLGLDDGIFRIYSLDEKRLADTKELVSKISDPFILIKKFAASSAVHPNDRHLFDCLTKEGIKKRLSESKKFSIRYRRNYGQGYLWSVVDVVKYEDVNEEANVIAVGFGERDKETRHEYEQQDQLKQALSMAQSANRAKTTFLNNMSHDIRTPMNAIIGYTGLAASHIDNKEQVRDYLEKINQSSNHLLSLINDVLDMSRIESGKMHLEEKEENLSEIIHTLCDIVQPDIRTRKLDFFVDTIDVADEDIFCDKLRLNQVLLNILSNAIKYTSLGGRVTMHIKERPTEKKGVGAYEFCISDTGMGMSKEFLTTIFEPFTRVKSSTVSGVQGTGLGMAITKNIVDMMEGTIDIQSAIGKGTTVTVAFEFRIIEEPDDKLSISSFKGLSALVIDDDEGTCESICNMIKDSGMSADWFTSGKEAVGKVESSSKKGKEYDIYFIDCFMPSLDGIETTRKIRKIVGKEAPIIVLTAYDWSDIEDDANEAGVTMFMGKPLFPSDLYKILKECFALKKTVKNDKEQEYNFAGKKLLIVEDNEVNREIAIELLSERGFSVDTAENGLIAVKKMKNAKTGDYDAVLMDIQMPVMDGYEATRKIRASYRKTSNIPIIAMTANAFEEDRKAALDAGMDEYIAKPIDIKALLELLGRILKL